MPASSSDPVKLSKRPAITAFKQQQLKAWQPLLSPLPVILSFVALGIVFIPIGAALLVASYEVIEVIEQYDERCALGASCSVTMHVPSTMAAPVFVYYRLENYFQNHRRYVKSRNDQQLRGLQVKDFNSLQDCDPRRSVNNDHNTDPASFYLPCGLIAWSMFNDTFAVKDAAGNDVALRKKGIAWSSDVDMKFKNPPAGTPGVRVVADFEDEEFINWMRTAGLPTFRKLYRIIDHDLPAGDYTVNIQNNYPVSSFGGKKSVVLSTTSWIGGKNPFLGWAYLVVGVVCLLQGVAFAIRHRCAPRKLGDTAYLDWSK
eukprot:TRINITY_DN5639_c0_g1_i4.p1 TRINITY_DN5639_c0_g1~~TRINITY_DN5639_c0_g1_i4.p1  ORF type:complete len:315 (+),score=117.36 TRINITY_DN5639_c0_g1_i4:143-1087(+)